MGVPEHKIFLVPYCVDNDRFIRSATLTDDQKINTRKQYSIPLDRPSILYAAKLVRGKRPGDLLSAIRRLSAERNLAFTAVMAGSGELEQELRSYCVDNL